LESSPTTIEKTILCCSAKGHLCQGTSFSDIPDITDIAKASFQRHETHLGDFEIMITGFIYVESNGSVLAPLWTFYKLLLEDFVHNFGQDSYKVGFASHYYLISKEENVLSVNQNSIEEMYRQNCVFCLKSVYLVSIS
jgi:hypothetical protein